MCGIAGVYTPGRDVSIKLVKILKKEWNRGHTSFGLETYDLDGKLHVRKGMRTPSEADLEGLVGDIGIGHQRYSTRGSNEPSFLRKNAQPVTLSLFEKNSGGFLVERCDHISEDDLKVRNVMSVAHNGDIFRNGEERDHFYECDVKYLAWPLADALAKGYDGNLGKKKLQEAARAVIPQLKGSFTFAGYTVDSKGQRTLFAGRDPWGIKPGFIGEVEGGYAVASENAALKTLGCKGDAITEMERGHFYTMDSDRKLEDMVIRAAEPSFCAFELIYFADMNSNFGGKSVARTRIELGRILGMEHPADADIVVGIPDSGRSVAIGYSYTTGLLYTEGYSKNRGLGDIRTFILQEQWQRDEGALDKNDPIRDVLEGMDVVITDDSLVRGTNIKKIVKRTREEGGASEVHVRIGCPPLISPCYLGIDMKARGEFAAANAASVLGYDVYKGFCDIDNMGLTKEELENTVEEIREEIGADSLGYLSFEGMRKVVGGGHCFGCWNPSLNPAELRAGIIDSIRMYPDGYRV
jgi:amidophosphoribosyltransferase